jgi:hypothetical protein
MKKPKLTQTRIRLAYAIAIIADTGKFPIFAVEATGFLAIPGAAADFAMDCFVAVAATVLLGFNWALLASFFAESIPGLDVFPTWTACVAYVVWQRKKEQAPLPVVEVEEVKPVRKNPPLLDVQATSVVGSDDSNSASRSIEDKLVRLKNLLEREFITKAEYEAKRQEVLNDL